MRGLPAFEAADVPDNAFKDGMVAEMAVGTLRNLSKKPEPFFLAVGLAKPHLPFVSPKKYWDLYHPAQIKLAPNPYHPKDAPEYALTNSNELRNYTGMPAEGPIPDNLARRLKHEHRVNVGLNAICGEGQAAIQANHWLIGPEAPTSK
jgi:iduronate 2-sulfatase